MIGRSSIGGAALAAALSVSLTAIAQDAKNLYFTNRSPSGAVMTVAK